MPSTHSGRVTRSRTNARLQPATSKAAPEDTNSSSDEDEDGIPAVIPDKYRSQEKPTLSARPSPVKRLHQIEDSQLSVSSKKQKTSETGHTLLPQDLQPCNSNGYPTPDSTRTVPVQSVDGDSNNDAHSVRTSIEADEYEDVAPQMVDMVNGMCYDDSRTVSSSSGGQLHEEAHHAEDNDSDVSDVDLNDEGCIEPTQPLGGIELEDNDLGIELTNQESPQHDGNTLIQHEGNEAKTAFSRRMDEDNKSAHQSTEELEVDAELHNTHTNMQDVSEIPPSPQHANTSIVSRSEKLHLSGSAQPTVTRSVLHAPVELSSKLPVEHAFQEEDTEGAAKTADRETPNQRCQEQLVEDSDDGPPTPTQLKHGRPPISADPGDFDPRNDVLSSRCSSPHTVASHNDSHSDYVAGIGDEISSPRRMASEGRNSAGEGDAMSRGRGVSSVAGQEGKKLNGADDIQLLFNRDLQRARADGNHESDDSIFFAAPLDTALVQIDLPSADLAKAKQLMRRLGWSAQTTDWEAKLMDKHQPQTLEGKSLVRYLLKLERLFMISPIAPKFADQNMFLSQHDDVLRQYLCAIDLTIEEVRATRLSFTHGTDPLNLDEAARLLMTKDLVRIVVPLLVRVLAQAWQLGGDEGESAFTESTVQMLAKLVGWLERMYNPLMRELHIRPIANSPKSDTKAREALGPFIKRLRNMLNDAPRRLQVEEEKRIRLEAVRQSNLRRQEGIKLLRILDSHTRQQAREIQNRRVAHSLREARSTIGIDRQTLSADWRREEELSLCKKLQSACDFDPPRLPKLGTIAFLLGHDEEAIKHKSRDLLREMFTQVYLQKTGRNIDRMVQDVMRDWR